MENEKIEQLMLQREKFVELQNRKKVTLAKAEAAIADYQEKIDGVDKKIEAVHVEKVKEAMHESNMSWEDVITLFGGDSQKSKETSQGEYSS